MHKKDLHPDLYTYKTYSIFPTSVQIAIFDLGKSIHEGNVTSAKIINFRLNLQGLSASLIPQAALEIRDIAQFNVNMMGRHTLVLPRQILRYARGQSTITRQLNTYPDLPWILLFHGDGFIRQAALDALVAPPNSQFEFAAIVYRFNDWVEEVRNSAKTYAEKTFQDTNPNIVAESSLFLLTQTRVLKRWGDAEKLLLENTFNRVDVLTVIKKKMLSVQSGPVSIPFLQLLCQKGFDVYLENLAEHAVMPPVRAISVNTLLEKRVKCFVKYEKEWIDKVYGVSKIIAKYQTRVVDVPVNVQQLRLLASRDKSATVRKVVARNLIANLPHATDEMIQIGRTLSADKYLSVRSLAEYFLLNCSDNNTVDQ